MNSITTTLENLGSLTRASQQISDYELKLTGPGQVLVAKNGSAYRCTAHSCTCKDFERRGDVRPCKHVHMTRAFLSVQPSETPEAKAARVKSERSLWD